ncbi:MAG TPA: helix-turn-helix domain-containing protein [Syntrophorhabdaceae bacterium]|nr:helix-turn-helix domain-containing protein [Syntrophorhabdaceae bacterium]
MAEKKPVEYEIESIRNEMEKGPLFYKLERAAEILNVSYLTVYRLIVSGEIDATKIAGVWRIPKQALINYLERRHPFNME